MSDEPLRCAGALILDDDGNVFVLRRSSSGRPFPDCWCIVGGECKLGESFEEAVRRQVYQATGWLVSHILAELGDVRYLDDDGRERFERDHLVRVEGNLAAPRLAPGRYPEWRWIGRRDLDTLDSSGGLGDEVIRRILSSGFQMAGQMGLI